MWIWQQTDWPNFTWQEQKLAPRLRNIRKLEGILQGKSELSGNQSDQILNNLNQNVCASAGLENDVDYQQLSNESVLSAVAKRLGIGLSLTTRRDPLAEGLAAIQMDVYKNYNHELGINRFYRWHVNLYSDLNVIAGIRIGAINVGKLRDEEEVHVVPGLIDKPVKQFEAPPKTRLKPELKQFLTWFKQSQFDESIDPILRAGLAHLWFMSLQPFDEGNGILGRALIDVALMQNNEKYLELYSFSAAMLENKKDYAEMLEYTQRKGMDVTHWMQWFLVTLQEAIQQSLDKLDSKRAKPVMTIASYARPEPVNVALNKHQVKVLQLMSQGGDEFATGISASHYQRLTRVSKATATRHLTDLLKKGCIEKLRGGGRSTRYRLNS